MATRASLYAVTENEVISSSQFNGDGHPKGWGILYIEMMERIKSIKDFATIVKKFNKVGAFNYDGTLIYYEKRKVYFNKKGFMDMNEGGGNDYFRRYNSDWIFIKNMTNKPFGIITTEGNYIGGERRSTPANLIILHPNEQVAMHYGSFEGSFRSVDECMETHRLKKEDIDEVARKLVLDSIAEPVKA